MIAFMMTTPIGTLVVSRHRKERIFETVGNSDSSCTTARCCVQFTNIDHRHPGDERPIGIIYA